jgi:hypothetical protein
MTLGRLTLPGSRGRVCPPELVPFLVPWGETTRRQAFVGTGLELASPLGFWGWRGPDRFPRSPFAFSAVFWGVAPFVYCTGATLRLQSFEWIGRAGLHTPLVSLCHACPPFASGRHDTYCLDLGGPGPLQRALSFPAGGTVSLVILSRQPRQPRAPVFGVVSRRSSPPTLYADATATGAFVAALATMAVTTGLYLKIRSAAPTVSRSQLSLAPPPLAATVALHSDPPAQSSRGLVTPG